MVVSASSHGLTLSCNRRISRVAIIRATVRSFSQHRRHCYTRRPGRKFGIVEWRANPCYGRHLRIAHDDDERLYREYERNE
jgi:hypothetical protein